MLLENPYGQYAQITTENVLIYQSMCCVLLYVSALCVIFLFFPMYFSTSPWQNKIRKKKKKRKTLKNEKLSLRCTWTSGINRSLWRIHPLTSSLRRLTGEHLQLAIISLFSLPLSLHTFLPERDRPGRKKLAGSRRNGFSPAMLQELF